MFVGTVDGVMVTVAVALFVVSACDVAVMVALVADGQACARFLAPDFIKTMLVEVGQGMTVGVGTPL